MWPYGGGGGGASHDPCALAIECRPRFLHGRGNEVRAGTRRISSSSHRWPLELYIMNRISAGEARVCLSRAPVRTDATDRGLVVANRTARSCPVPLQRNQTQGLFLRPRRSQRVLKTPGMNGPLQAMNGMPIEARMLPTHNPSSRKDEPCLEAWLRHSVSESLCYSAVLFRTGCQLGPVPAAEA